MKLAEAVKELSQHIGKGGELPEGVPLSLNHCPVAIYLTEKVGKPVSVISMSAWIDGERETWTGLPRNVTEWVRRFDRRARG